jgi:uncharacterized damage-inducible protein DinB
LQIADCRLRIADCQLSIAEPRLVKAIRNQQSQLDKPQSAIGNRQPAMTEITRILDQLEREHGGDPWHGSPLCTILDGIDARQAARKPIAAAHSIWELVLHVTGWKTEVARRVEGAPAGMPADGDWPEVGETTDARWTAALEELENAHRRLIAAIRALPESKLFQPTNDTRDRELGAGVSYYVLLHGAVQHDVYHAGQIAILKKQGN